MNRDHASTDSSYLFCCFLFDIIFGKGGAMPLIAHSSPDGRIQLFNEHVRAEFLNGELFETMHEAQVLTQRWVRYYNQVRPHSSLGAQPPPLKP